ncbi:hypothetical protein [Ketogulonicigenium vulgare]|uniref:Uncharacterized protein n=1 Tax=Ketogulonicigenium vulgare (strain WSH-001) TaxID=759362 RepID=F9Y960_KETVW|nr:hypothetical protein [Ketogulonicigenium vulgare]ADO43098.1 hypothetical protein EIO_1983 [Ketogulonicigenium vulgare Y25]AEM41277.1 hypothetical protein KVU_1438 [Ketogulonicigenium vulgare WSH-001]ALJ81414.1 hypothetical protein KVH_09610 [Ketogulonicigenium vulgare]ANW34138.1 hypothetical protein KvSKV_09560 [Ketogulonicigenium vulgare]AOZ55011.1 hypothetical protein KVC_2004 [Ketogulonicigenium vulgare]
MADCISTTSFRFPKVAASFRATPMTVKFGAVMRNLASYIEAERDLEHCDSVDPSCDAWIRDAERARAHVLDAISALHAAPILRAEDMPLRRYAELTQMLIQSDSATQFCAIAALPARFYQLFHCSGPDLTAHRVNLLIAAFDQHLHALATLSDFTDFSATGEMVAPSVTADTMWATAA